MTNRLRTLLKFSVASLALVASASAKTPEGPNVLTGRAKVYENLDPRSLEAVSTPEQIQKLGASNVPATRIWKVLEHGEKLECLSCIPVVSKFLYNGNAKTREIGAWWLRRRIFGVFGPGQVYEQTLATLADASQTEARRAYAANALGEFLVLDGVKAVSAAVVGDPSARVRAAAVGALERLNSPGQNAELTSALGDADENVRLLALRATTHINAFNDVEAVVGLVSDPSPLVRRRALETLGALRAEDALLGIIALASPEQESEASVRAAAVWALGQIGDPQAADAIDAATEDDDAFVRSAAAIARRQLRL